MTYLDKAIELLRAEGYTSVVCGENDIYTSRARGVKPLVAWYASGLRFHGLSAADKVVGRATAFLYLLLGVRKLHAVVISRPALALLEAEDITVHYDALVPHISNRAHDGICPFEEAVMDIGCRDDAYTAIRRKMEELSITLD